MTKAGIGRRRKGERKRQNKNNKKKKKKKNFQLTTWTLGILSVPQAYTTMMSPGWHERLTSLLVWWDPSSG